MKYFKYLFTIFLVLGSVLIGVTNVKAQEVPDGVNSIEKKVLFWEYDGRINDEILVKSNRFYISDFYKYFLFDLKFLSGRSGSGPFATSQGIYFYSSSTTNTVSRKIFFDELNFDNFINMSNQIDRWIQFKFIHKLQYNETVESYINSINNNLNYDLSVLAISGSGIIVEDDLYTYLTNYVDTVISNRIDNAYQDGYNNAKNEFGYNDNGIIIPGESAYDKGYNKATQESGSIKASIINFVPGVLGAIFMFFFQLGQIGILGITILDILGILVLIAGLIFVIKFFF